ncbi:hypothetical protein NQ317_008293 [Molorchus minor]|uniref:Carboxypeptidase activation peptide domain-containing protein n=1 Tax=Molorchus minor TaxID=1323400 RepID=A0ABQ9J2S1_9CUCU|nr:hypothetical protein NQ317_008293 [Molorchus minor]
MARLFHIVYKVYQVTAKSLDEIDILTRLEDDERVDFWSKHRVTNRPMDVMVSPSAQGEFETVLTSNRIVYNVIIANFEE